MLKIVQIAVLEDNYNFIIHNEKTNETAVVDPSEAKPILDVLAKNNWKLDYILNTHHHWDHVGANDKLRKLTGCKIFGNEADKDRITQITNPIKTGEVLSVLGSDIEVIDTPGHTLGHISYYFPDDKLLFCGDVLFAMGCGRLFEGSAEQMYKTLQIFKQLPDDVIVYCAHEYTESNGDFSLTVEPNNFELQKRVKEVKKLRQKGMPTIPTSIGEEKLTNPFLRARNVEEFTKIRKVKDSF